MTTARYPVHVDATLDPRMSRWLWLVKWILAIPHYVVLLFLWFAFVVVSAVAFFAILFTGTYPRALFDFNVGVLRWSWRVAYYTYGALGTDRYPPFTLAEAADYPAHLEIDYPAHLSRGLVLVKWWLLAIPHYLVVGIFLGGGTWAVWQATDRTGGGPGLIGVLVLIAALALAFTGRYPQQIFDFVLGMNRWALRVAAYAGLMTDQYPPFRLDMGGHEPAGSMTVPAPGPPAPPDLTKPAPPPAGRGWTAARIVSLVIGSIVGLVALGTLAAGGVATWATNSQRDSAGYVTSGSHTFSTTTSAITSDSLDLGTAADWITPSSVLGTLRLRVTSSDAATPVFVGIAPQSAADAYLTGMSRAVVTNWPQSHTRTLTTTGAGPVAAPAGQNIWTAHTAGTGTQTLTWRPSAGHWVVVVMNADATPGVTISADIGATVPDLGLIAGVLIASGLVLLAGAVVLIVVPVIRASR